MGDSLGGGSERVFVPNNLFGFNTAYASKADAESLVKVLGTNNLSVGKQNLISILSGAQNNTVIGIGEGNSITTSSNNVVLGDGALTAQVTGGTDAGKNTAVGVGSLDSALASFNTALGYKAGQNITTGSKNVFIGSTDQTASGSNIDNCICIGHNAGSNNNESIAATSNYVIFGNKNITNYVFCGDGPSPDNKLILDFPNVYMLEVNLKAAAADRYIQFNSGIRAGNGIAATGTDNIFCPGIDLWSNTATTFGLCTSSTAGTALTTMNYGKTGVTHTFTGTLKSNNLTLGSSNSPSAISSFSGGLTLQGGAGATPGNPTIALASAGQITFTCGGTDKNIILSPSANGLVSIGGTTPTITTFGTNQNLNITPNGTGIVTVNSGSGSLQLNTVLGEKLRAPTISSTIKIGQYHATSQCTGNIIIGNNYDDGPGGSSGNIQIKSGTTGIQMNAAGGGIQMNAAGVGNIQLLSASGGVQIDSGSGLLTINDVIQNKVMFITGPYGTGVLNQPGIVDAEIGVKASDQCMYYCCGTDSNQVSTNNIVRTKNPSDINQPGRRIRFHRTTTSAIAYIFTFTFYASSNSPGETINIFWNGTNTGTFPAIANPSTDQTDGVSGVVGSDAASWNTGYASTTLTITQSGFEAICLSGPPNVRWMISKFV